MLERTTKYALEALIYLSEHDEEGYLRIEVLSKKIDVPGPYLSKIMQRLAAEGIVETKKGVKGGVRLAPRKEGLSFFEVCRAMEDPLVSAGCMLRNGVCSKSMPCQFHDEWSAMKRELAKYFVRLRVSKS